MMTDPVSDFINRIKNCLKSGNNKLSVPGSRIKAGICKVLKEEGYLKNFKIVIKNDNRIWIVVLFKENSFRSIKRVSTPGLRVYSSYKSMPRVSSGLGVSVVSTSKGIISSRTAKSIKIGGEILCNIW